jgi:hypothetical protein
MTAVPEDPGRIAVHAAVIPAAAVAPLSNQAYGRPPSPRAASCAWNPTSPRSPPCLSRPGRRGHCSSSGGTTPQARSRRLRPVQLLQACSAACAAFLMAWIIFLSAALPAQAVAHEWKLAWIGLDVTEAAGLLVVTWAARRLREMLIPAAIVTGTLLVCDAWFDVILSWGTSDWRWSALSAVAVELPLATLLFVAARQMTKATDAGLTARRGPGRPSAPPAPAPAAGADRPQRPNRCSRSVPPRRMARQTALPCHPASAARPRDSQDINEASVTARLA